MKTEAEIREHIRELHLARKVPCTCEGTEHESQCEIGGRMMESSIASLSWVIGENPDYQRIVRKLHQHAVETG